METIPGMKHSADSNSPKVVTRSLYRSIGSPAPRPTRRRTAPKRQRSIAAALALYICCNAIAQEAEKQLPGSEREANAPAPAPSPESRTESDLTIALSPALQENLLRRVVLNLSDRYALTGDQTTEITSKLLPRWKSYLAKEKDRLAPVLSELLEMRLALEPPTEERVADWSRRASDVFDAYLNEAGQASGEIRETLTPEQRLRFDADLMQMKLGLGVLRTRLQQGIAGTGSADGFWNPPRRGTEETNPNRSAERKDIGRKPLALDPIEKELLLWQAHVDEFAARYKLDEGQRDAAASVLVELSGRALAHRDRHRAEITRLESAIETGDGSEEELARIREAVGKLYGPVDALFQELDARLQAIPSDKQKESAREKSRVPQRTGGVQMPARNEPDG